MYLSQEHVLNRKLAAMWVSSQILRTRFGPNTGCDVGFSLYSHSGSSLGTKPSSSQSIHPGILL